MYGTEDPLLLRRSDQIFCILIDFNLNLCFDVENGVCPFTYSMILSKCLVLLSVLFPRNLNW